MRVNDCFKRRLLRKVKPDLLKVQKALEMSERKRERAKELFINRFYEESIVSSYTSMFQAVRALLFKDGVTEKSHACVIAYLKEHYANSLGLDRVSWLDTYRLERHESFYGLDPSELDKQEAKDAINKSERFFSSIKNIIEEM
jgi:uncharacterized protein (UPF0332 family)